VTIAKLVLSGGEENGPTPTFHWG